MVEVAESFLHWLLLLWFECTMQLIVIAVQIITLPPSYNKRFDFAGHCLKRLARTFEVNLCSGRVFVLFSSSPSYAFRAFA